MKTYHIYGRTSYAGPLTLIEAINVASDTDLSQTVLEQTVLEQTVLAQHGETDWVELVAIPETKIIWARHANAESAS